MTESRALHRRSLAGARTLLALLAAAGSGRAAELHVDQARGADANDGLSWATALLTVNEALRRAATSPETDTVRVAEGRYRERLVVPPGVELLGGYASGGSARDIDRHRTVLDGQRQGTVVRFGPSALAGLLEGFTVTGGEAPADTDGTGGVRVERVSVTIRHCVIEGNTGCVGGGVALMGSGPAAAPRIEDCIVRGNVARCCCEGSFGGRGGGIHIDDDQAPADPQGTAAVRCLVEGNRQVWNRRWRPLGGGVGAIRNAWLEGLLVRGNEDSGVSLVSSGCVVRNSEVSGNSLAGVTVPCARDLVIHHVESCTIARNGQYGIVGANYTFPYESDWVNPSWRLNVVAHHPFDVAPSGAYPGVCGWYATDLVQDNLIEDGFEGGTDIVTADPLFVAGPAGDFYLSQLAAGQVVDSPALDAGNVTAAEAGLDALTTRTDLGPDSGALDLGVHYPVTDLGGRPLAPLAVLRGPSPTDLVEVASVGALPWTDDPGVLVDPARPLLFYSVESLLNEIRVAKELTTASVRVGY
jgi:hypothetical protein